ncbi:bifunctional pyr operon transcriptional regulator/uracil phosphoribosyltransferase PyrR [candidate division KSB1 bacterium]
MKIKEKAKVMDEKDLERTLIRLSHEIIEKNRGAGNLGFVGMQTRGVFLAKRIAQNIHKIEGQLIPVGILDVTLYRDDFRQRLKQPIVQITEIPFSVDEKDIIIIDDVLFTGRTIRAALDSLMDFGRPASIQLAVLVDRGHRELPISADYIGEKIITSIGEEIRVNVKEIDNEDSVYLVDIIVKKK